MHGSWYISVEFVGDGFRQSFIIHLRSPSSSSTNTCVVYQSMKRLVLTGEPTSAESLAPTTGGTMALTFFFNGFDWLFELLFCVESGGVDRPGTVVSGDTSGSPVRRAFFNPNRLSSLFAMKSPGISILGRWSIPISLAVCAYDCNITSFFSVNPSVRKVARGPW